jgi:hypothetical protein
MSAFCVSFFAVLVSFGPPSGGANVSGRTDAAPALGKTHQPGEHPMLVRETLPAGEAMGAKDHLSGGGARDEHREPSAKPARVRQLLSAHRPATPRSALCDVLASDWTTLQLLGVRLQI